MSTPRYQPLAALLYKSPTQNQMPGNTAWNCMEYEHQTGGVASEENMPLISLTRDSAVSHDGEADSHRPSTGSQLATGISLSRDSSPEVEIMEVRKRQPKLSKTKEPIGPSSVSRDRSTVALGKSKGTMKPELTAQATLPKTESFDMSLLDPRLRNIESSQPKSMFENSNAEEITIGAKRMAESDDDITNKRLKSGNESSTQFHLESPTRSAASNTPQLDLKSLPAPQAIVPAWLPNTWTKADYFRLASAVEQSFNYVSYAQHSGRHPAEVADVFRGLVLFPILNITDQFPGGATNDPEALMLAQNEAKHKLATIIAAEDAGKFAKLKAIALAEVGSELRALIERDLRAQLRDQGWVQLNVARERLSTMEREMSETRSLDTNPAEKTKQKVKTIEEAKTRFLEASTLLAKAQKAEDRKNRLAEKEAKGLGTKKLGRPKKGDGKGKGADFV